ncbi:hypothetical protein TSUD_210000 [Trifolium subterraneum]|uniref:HTH La-type RNA-binding domain-containing protein n=1 Tax=Trifolium subterraneum TaxID=3900 RepID=A0A2Z6MPE2_TRISU|nr:hypothetical protein TSUD_210000 [Trifolium subterraneum]
MSSSPNHPSAAAPLSPPPWTQIVSSPSAVIDTSVNTSPIGSSFVEEDLDNNNNADIGKRQVWSKPSNAAASSVMGADSWPALSESAKAPAKSPPPPPIELVQTSLDASTSSQLQGIGSMLPTPQAQVNDTASLNNVVPGPTHQRPYRRTNSNASSNGYHLPQMSAPQGSVAVPPGSHNQTTAPEDNPPRAGFVPNYQPQHRNSFRNRNGGPHPRGDGSHHHNYGNRRDQDRRNQDLNAHQRNFNGRDNYRSPRFGPQFFRPPPPAVHAQYYYYPPPPPPSPIPPYGGSYAFPELPPPMIYAPPMEPLRGVPYVPPPIPPNAIFVQPPITELHTKIVNQINYYFSDANLHNDTYLKMNMDDQGWVPLSLIAGFKKVKFLTDNIQIVLDAVRTSNVVEVQGDKIRRRNDWMNWITPSTQIPNVTGSQTVGQLAENFQSIALETNKSNTTGGLDVSQSSNRQYLISTSEGTVQGGIQQIENQDHSASAKS